jgi:hypothetical protein
MYVMYVFIIHEWAGIHTGLNLMNPALYYEIKKGHDLSRVGIT